ncbi:MAG TPA: beta-propeller fold lactonase family protein [Microlunatus sp.]|nr:beta-propeller fold lactonase family protein [Microlunatus sp.]
MPRFTRLCAVGASAVALGVFSAAPSIASAAVDEHGRSRDVVFVQNDAPDGNTVFSYDRAVDGSLRPAGSYATGGRGGKLTGAVVDNTASQGSLTLDRARGLLYAVNAGSNTVSVFDVHGTHLDRRTVVNSHGDFPVSVTARGDIVYVLNARSGGSVQGYRWADGSLVPTSHRDLGLDPTLTPEFTHTPGQVAIAPGGRHVVVTTKAATNSIVVYNLDRVGRIQGAPVVSNQAGKVPFAVAFSPRGLMVVANAGDNSLSSFRIGTDGSLDALANASTGQRATCWVAADGHRFFASNAGSATVSGFELGRQGALTALGNTSTDPGTVDATVSSDHRFLYVQAGADGRVDAFRIGADGALTGLGSVTVPNAAGAEGIASS